MQRAIQNTQAATRRRSRPLRVAGSTLTANVAFAVLKYAALTAAGVLLFRWGQGYALAERGYKAIGGEALPKTPLQTAGAMKPSPQKCSLQAQRKSGLQTKTGLQRVQSWPCSATTQAALPIVRKRPLTKVITGAIRRLRRRGIGGFARRIPASRTMCALSTLRGR